MRKARNRSFSLEREIIDQIVKANLTRAHLLVAVSGGADSLALALACARVRDRLKFMKVTWAHVHHGSVDDRAQFFFRDRALLFLQNLAKKQNVELVVARLEKNESSEAGWRKLRYDRLKHLMRKRDADVVALAHTQTDLLETRLLRLIRGVGPKGLESMRVRKGIRFRPLLSCTRQQIEDYLLQHNQAWLADPSNQDLKHARNQLRKQILVPLAKLNPRAVEGLTRSLARIADDLKHYDEFMAGETAPLLSLKSTTLMLERSGFLNLDERTKRGVLTHYIRLLNDPVFSEIEVTRRHVEEIAKRLNNRSEASFEVAGLTWIQTDRHVWAVH